MRMLRCTHIFLFGCVNTHGSMASKKTHYVHRHCRILKSDKKAKSPCTRKGKSGTVVKGHYSPKKHSKKHSAATKIQAIQRGRTSRRTTPKRRGPSRKHVSAAKITAALRKFSERRSQQKKKAARLAKVLKQLS